MRKIILVMSLCCVAVITAQEPAGCGCPKKKASKREMAQLREDVVDQALECMETIHTTTIKIVGKGKDSAAIVTSFAQIGLELVGLSRQLVDDERNSFVAKADEHTLRSLLDCLQQINSASEKDITGSWASNQEKTLKKICCSDILNSK